MVHSAWPGFNKNSPILMQTPVNSLLHNENMCIVKGITFLCNYSNPDDNFKLVSMVLSTAISIY